jgi:hypothetical protein
MKIRPLNSLIIVLGTSIAFASISYLVSWLCVLANRQPPSLLPSPPLEPVSIVAIEIGTGFEAADLIVEVDSG